MDSEQPKDAADELYVLGFIAGLCNQEPRDQTLLEDMLLFLREAQEVRVNNSGEELLPTPRRSAG